MRHRPFTAADLFCGAGGTTQGATEAGVKVVLAVNHWRTAIYSHEANHPGTRHICARIDDIDPRNDATLPDFNLLMASPECTHHSIARGGRPVSDQKRTTPWHVCVWSEAKRPAWILVENVREFRDWGPIDEKGRVVKTRKGETFLAWIRSIESLGYQVDHQLLNAADFGAATKRVRLFIVARRRRSRRDIPWPSPTHAGRWRPAYEIIDWSRPCPSIFARKRPLVDKTLRRIEAGLRKFVGAAAEPFIVTLRRNMDARRTSEPLATITAGAEHHALAFPFMLPRQGFYDCRRDKPAAAIDDPLNTITANHGPGHLVVPFIVPHFGERAGQEPRTHGVDEPAPTVTGQGAGSLVMPFLTQFHDGPDGSNRNYHPGDPLPTLDTQNRYGLVVPYLLAINHGGEDDRSHSPADPLATLTTKTGHSVVLPFLTKYYGTGSVQDAGEPLDTITTKDRFGLAMASLLQTMQELHVVDIGFRMLDVDELAAAQGFPVGYQLHGTKGEQVRQVGNSVSPNVARAICQTIMEAA